jgi:uncharacterized protein (TIGR02588 family)
MTRPEKNTLEWTVFGLSAALVLAIAGFLVYAHLRDENRPASIRIEAGEPVPTAGGWAVPLDVFNDGDRTAEGVRIEAAFEGERSETELAFVPYRSHRQAWVTFTRRPASSSIQVRVVGYRDP